MKIQNCEKITQNVSKLYSCIIEFCDSAFRQVYRNIINIKKIIVALIKCTKITELKNLKSILDAWYT